MELVKKTILIVEDETSQLKALTEKFTREGFNVLDAKNGEEGLTVALENQPDIILLDILMPQMNGVDMLKKLRQDTWGKTVPVILLTNLNADDDSVVNMIREATEATQDEAANYLVKSNWTIDDVVKKVREKLSQ